MNPRTLQRLQQQYMRLQGRNDLRPSQQQKLSRITQQLGAQNPTGITGKGLGGHSVSHPPPFLEPGMQPPLSPYNVPQTATDPPSDPYQPGTHSVSHPPPFLEQVQQPALLGQPMPNPYTVDARPIPNYPNDPYQPGMQPMPNPYGTTTQQDIMGGGGTGTPFGQVMGQLGMAGMGGMGGTGTPFGQVLGQLGMGGMGGMPTQQTPLPQAPNSTGAGAGGAGLGAAFNQMFGR